MTGPERRGRSRRRRWAVVVLVALAARSHGEIGAEDLAKKREGWYPTGWPIADYSSDTGYGYGAAAILYYDGSRQDPHFADAPYAVQFLLMGLVASRGMNQGIFETDVPHVGDTDLRLRSEFEVALEPELNYFGPYAQSFRPLPGGTFARYQDGLDAAEPLGAGSTMSRYDEYILRSWNERLQLEYEVSDAWKVMAGFYCSNNHITPYDGRSVHTPEGVRTQGPTRLTVDAPAGLRGGWENFYRIGAAWDTRDFEPAPKRGWFVDATGEFAGPAAGSDFTFNRLTLAARTYVTVVHHVVAAGRASYAAEDGDPPFFDETAFDYLEEPIGALGGGFSLRGYKALRFYGHAASLVNLELRWDAVEFMIAKERFIVTLVGFGDGGRTYPTAAATSFRDWKYAVGGGPRLSWNLSTIISANYGRSPEDSDLTVTYGHLF